MGTEKRAKTMSQRILQGQKKDTAIALEYESGDVAPKVIATGKGYLAEKIVETAKEHNIPIHQDEKLAKGLENLDLGEYIPKELYQVVAEVLVYVDAMDKVKGKVMDKDILKK